MSPANRPVQKLSTQVAALPGILSRFILGSKPPNARCTFHNVLSISEVNPDLKNFYGSNHLAGEAI